MKSLPYVEAFRQLDTADLPDVHGLETERLQVLWVLTAAKKGSISILAAAEISDILQQVCRVAISRQRIGAILGAEKGTVTRVGRKAPARFQIMKKVRMSCSGVE